MRVILPLAIALGLIAWIASLAAAPKSGPELWHVVQQTWLIVLVLTFPYLAARAVVWFRLMAQLGIHVPLRQAAVSFAGGEITKSLPGGIYVENYLLTRLVHFGRHSAIRSSMATTAMLGLETLIAVPISLIVGIPGERWLFWTILGVVIAWLVVLVLAWTLVHYWVPRHTRDKTSLIHRAADVADEFLGAGSELLTVQTLIDCIPTALYMFVYVIDLFVILRALGVSGITVLDTMAIYSVVVLAVVLVPIPTELGITELTGLGALVAYGVPGRLAALAMLALRMLATGTTIVVAAVIIIALRRQLTRAEERTESRSGAQP